MILLFRFYELCFLFILNLFCLKFSTLFEIPSDGRTSCVRRVTKRRARASKTTEGSRACSSTGFTLSFRVRLNFHRVTNDRYIVDHGGRSVS
jgi:hypothetical protein